MTVFQTIAILLTFAAISSYINKRFLHLPTSVGMMLLALLISWTAMGLARLGLVDLTAASAFINHIDFSNILLHGMLSFLLFAGALQIDLAELKRYRIVVALLATVGVVIATFVTASVVWEIARILGLELPYLAALLFGALIAPTDPVAVMGILKDSSVSKALQLKISAESLLNDGVGVVIFLILLNLAARPQDIDHQGAATLAAWALWSGIGSVIIGLAFGWVTSLVMRGIDDYKTEALLTLALASGGYCFAEAIAVSAPITMVVAGLMIGNHGRSAVLPNKPRKHLDMFWELADDILNAVLFVLIGLEIMVVPLTLPLFALGLAAIIATLAGRFVSVALPIHLLNFRYQFERGAIRLMTWGGLRGGISIAMALSLPTSPYKKVVLGMTYLTVVFSVLFQGTSFATVVKRIMRK